jgi:hypothetical protein
VDDYGTGFETIPECWTNEARKEGDDMKTTRSDRLRAGYFKLEIWRPEIGAWSPKSRQLPTLEAAQSAATQPGRYRITRFDDDGQHNLTPFDVGRR